MKRALRQFCIVTCTMILGMGIIANQAYACCLCAPTAGQTSVDEWQQTIEDLNRHLDSEFNAQETWMMNALFEDNILPAMMLMAEQLTVVAMEQVAIVGSFFDAKNQLEAQRELQKLQAETHKDYHPSIGMCEFGSNIRSLAASERKGEIAKLALSKRTMDRQLGTPNSSGTFGLGLDKQSRIAQFKDKYCDTFDQNTALSLLCGGGGSGERTNKDIDYTRAVDAPWTLDVDFTDTNVTEDEEDVFALASYLYSHDVFARAAPLLLQTPDDNRIDATLTGMQQAYLDMRAIVAKRSVAENSYNSIVGLKAAGEDGSRDHMIAILADLGVTDADELDELLGENPSYYAQMEVLTKKIYQNPTFYTNLYDKPANVIRKDVSMQAIGLMQKFDMFKSYLRNEANLSVLLELSVAELQQNLEDRILGLESNLELAD